MFGHKVYGPPFIAFPWALQKLGKGCSYSLIVSAPVFLWSLLLSLWLQQTLDPITSSSSPHLSHWVHTFVFVTASNSITSKTYISNILGSDNALQLIFPAISSSYLHSDKFLCPWRPAIHGPYHLFPDHQFSSLIIQFTVHGPCGRTSC